MHRLRACVLFSNAAVLLFTTMEATTRLLLQSQKRKQSKSWNPSHHRPRHHHLVAVPTKRTRTRIDCSFRDENRQRKSRHQVATLTVQTTKSRDHKA